MGTHRQVSRQLARFTFLPHRWAIATAAGAICGLSASLRMTRSFLVHIILAAYDFGKSASFKNTSAAA